MSTELACTEMYTMFACGEQAGFVFLPSPSYAHLLLSSDVPVTHRPAFHLVLLPLLLSFCLARGLCILSKCAVCKSVQLRVSFCFVLVLLLHRTY